MKIDKAKVSSMSEEEYWEWFAEALTQAILDALLAKEQADERSD